MFPHHETIHRTETRGTVGEDSVIPALGVPLLEEARKNAANKISMVVEMVPLKGGIGSIVHPPIGRKNIPLIYHL